MRGHTLVEMLIVVLLAGIVVASMAPAARRQRDRALAVAAREAVVAVFSAARMAAVEAGAATVLVTANPARVEAMVGGYPIRTAALGTDFGVAVDLGGAVPSVELAYDGLGLGKVASQTITIRRGGETTQVVVSGYGRVRRR